MKVKETLRDTSNKSTCFLTDAEIQEKLAYLDSLNGKEPDREVLIAGIAHKYICYEVWSRETGHMWNTYSPFHRTPTEKEMDFADLDATGRPSIKWDDFDSRPEESSAEPQVGDSWTYEQYGKRYSKTITFVRFRGMVYEDTEGYDVEYYEKEL